MRWSGNDEDLIELATENAMRISAGHSFILFLGEGFFPINILNNLKSIPEVVNIFCATANPTEVVLLETEQGRAVWASLTDYHPKGLRPKGHSDPQTLLRMIGYKS